MKNKVELEMGEMFGQTYFKRGFPNRWNVQAGRCEMWEMREKYGCQKVIPNGWNV